MNLVDLKNKKALILALGKYKHGSGVGAAKFCLRQGMKIRITDLASRKDLKVTIGEVEKAYREYRKRRLKVFKPVYILGRHRDEDIRWADMVVQGPAVPFDSKQIELAEKLGKPVETDISLFFRFCPYPVIGITGTRGKSTTTVLLYEILKTYDPRAVLGGNIQLSALDSLDRLLALNAAPMNSSMGAARNVPAIVLELSSWQIEGLARLRKSPHIAAITNISPDHLNRYGTMKKYIQAKELIFSFQDSGDVAVLNRDNPITKKMGTKVTARRFWFSMKPFAEENGAFFRGDKLVFRENGIERVLLARRDIKLPGEHNVENILLASCLASLLGVPDSLIRTNVRTFCGVPSRLEIVRTVRGVTYVNDTTATSPEGAIAALKSFPGKNLVALAGGADKNLDFNELARLLGKRAKAVILFRGAGSTKIIRHLPKNTRATIVDSMDEAVEQAQVVAERGDIVLLSPGAASFGIFQNEFDRGDQFVKLVKKM